MSQTDHKMRNRNDRLKMLNCKVCSSATVLHVIKDFKGYYGLNLVNYIRCKTCGFVYSPTIYDLPEQEFKQLNDSYHQFLKKTGCPDDPKWSRRLKKQAIQLYKLFEAGVLPSVLPVLDFGCGNGRLIKILQDFGCSNIVGYEPYMKSTVNPEVRTITDKDLQRGKFGCVISTSFLEHVRDLTVIDRMCELVSPNGAFIFHTFVGEEIPVDPEWFYFLPPHCSFYTDRAMSILFERHSFKSATHIRQGNLHVWSRLAIPGFMKGSPAKYEAEKTD